MIPACVDDYAVLARKRLPRLLADYIDGGAYAEDTLRRNVADFRDVHLRQRVLCDVSKLSTEIELFGRTYTVPFGLGPVGMAGMYARRGETQAARAATAAGVPFTLSTMSICGVGEVARAADEGAPPIWFQLYMIRDRVFMAEVLASAKAAGCEVLVFTVDLPVPGARYREVRNGGHGAASLANRLRTAVDGLAHPGWFGDVFLQGRPHTLGNIAAAVPNSRGMADFWGWVVKNFDPSVTWADLDWVRARWDGPLVIKGVLDVDDARASVSAGAEGIVVSNHGGRQLDGVPSAIAALPAIAREVGGQTTVLMDGGVRTGLDVLKAQSLGAQAVLLGRAWAWALGARGGEGVAGMLSILNAELKVAMALTGCTDIRLAGPELLVRQS